MKRKLLTLGVLGLVPFMTACGGSKNKLTCSYSPAEGLDSKIELLFDGDDKLNGVSIEESITLKEAGCESFDECKQTEEETLNRCKESENYENCKLTHSGDNIMVITADVSSQGLKDESLIGAKEGATKEEVKTSYESKGYKCE